jgi:LmbE family N-acetylglucosaminyl deacetylase
VILSPHIDDAFLSLGGLLNEFKSDGIPYHIIYIFSLSNWTNQGAPKSESITSSPEKITALRKMEELNVKKFINHTYDCFDFPDQPLREEQSQMSLLNLAQQIRDRVTNMVSKDDLLYFPIAISHPDHIITRRIGMELMKMGYNVAFYEDMPYVAFSEYFFDNDFKLTSDLGFVPHVVPIDVHQKLNIIKNYSSQVTATWLKDIKNYSYSLVDNKYYERIWFRHDYLSEYVSNTVF